MDQEAQEFLNGYARRKKTILEPGKLWVLPEKPLIVEMFEKMKESERREARESPDYKEIKAYYDRVNDVGQHNVGEHAWRQQIGYEPEGPVEYVNGMFVIPLRDKIPKDQQWEIGPDKRWHRPDCQYRNGGYREGICECNPSRKRMKFVKKEAL